MKMQEGIISPSEASATVQKQKKKKLKKKRKIPCEKVPEFVPLHRIWSSGLQCEWSWGEEHQVHWSLLEVGEEGCYPKSLLNFDYPPPPLSLLKPIQINGKIKNKQRKTKKKQQPRKLSMIWHLLKCWTEKKQTSLLPEPNYISACNH